MEIDAAVAAAGIEDALARVGTPERAEGERRYLKSDLRFLGTTVWEIRRVARAFAAEHPDMTVKQLTDVVEALWAEPVHERRMAAVMLLDAYPALVGPDRLPLLERLVRESKTWALVDGLSTEVMGSLLVRHPSVVDVLDTWATDPDFWIRRGALLAWLRPLREGAPMDRFARYADGMLDEREFFIRKAIGWVLRETAKRRPDDVSAWLAPRTHRASGVTMREAVKYLPPADAERLTAAYREGRPAA